MLALMLLSSASIAQNLTQLEDLDNLDAKIADVVSFSGSFSTKALPLDRRLHLAKCADSVVIEMTTSESIALRCPSRGWRVRVPLILPSAAEKKLEDVLIHRGDIVELDYVGNGFTVSVFVRSMDEGVRNQTIRVINTTSSAPTSATVVDRGLVEIRSDRTP
jgi:flagella basal body P-ring formation protein FlgA